MRALSTEEITSKRNNKIYRYFIRRYKKDTYNYNHFKRIINDQEVLLTNEDSEIKRIYDAYNFLMSNVKTGITSETIKIMYYMFFLEEIEKFKADDIIGKIYEITNKDEIENIVKITHYIYKLFSDKDEFHRILLTFFILNYLLKSYNYSTIILNDAGISEFIELLENYPKSKENFVVFILNNIYKGEQAHSEDKERIDVNLLANKIYKEKKFLKDKCNVQGVVLFGSYARESSRLDSDVDLFIKFKEDISYYEKEESLKRAKEYLRLKLERIIDMHELPYIVNSREKIEIMKESKIIFMEGQDE